MPDEQDRRLVEVLGFLAHELRNSVAAALLGFRAIRSGTLKDIEPTANLVEKSLAQIGGLIDQSLALVLLGSDAALKIERIGIGELLREAQAASLLSRVRDGVTIELSVEDELACDGDRLLLKSALVNLVQNAIKFTPAGAHVRVGARADGDRVRIEVEDRCGGLATDRIDALLANSRAHQQGGLGFGLRITKRAIDVHGGTLELTNLPGMGCRFSVEIPRRLRADPNDPPGK
jgi:signal transduction histidine kinase